MGVGTPVNMRVFVSPLDQELEMQTLLLSSVQARVRLEAFLEKAIQAFLVFQFRCDSVPGVEVKIE